MPLLSLHHTISLVLSQFGSKLLMPIKMKGAYLVALPAFVDVALLAPVGVPGLGG